MDDFELNRFLLDLLEDISITDINCKKAAVKNYLAYIMIEAKTKVVLKHLRVSIYEELDKLTYEEMVEKLKLRLGDLEHVK